MSGGGRNADTGRYDARYTPDKQRKPPTHIGRNVLVSDAPLRTDKRYYNERRVAEIVPPRFRRTTTRRFDDRKRRPPPLMHQQEGRRIDTFYTGENRHSLFGLRPSERRKKGGGK